MWGENLMLLVYRIVATVMPIALEGLPVSSSGHVLLYAELLQKICANIVEHSVPRQLDHLVHLPIAIMVALFFLPRWYYLLSHIHRLWQQFFKMILLGFVTVLVTGFLYLLLKQIGIAWFPLWLGYVVTTILLFSLHSPTLTDAQFANNKRFGNILRNGQWNIITALILGAAQGLALLPGISRLGITYTTARWLGMRPQKAFELSFLIEWPISVAGFLKGIYDMHQTGGLERITSFDIFLMIGASILGYFGLWVMQWLVTANRVWQVGWYTAILSIIALIFSVSSLY